MSFEGKRAYSQIAKWCKTIGNMCDMEIVRFGESTWNEAKKSERWRTQGESSKPMID